MHLRETFLSLLLVLLSGMPAARAEMIAWPRPAYPECGFYARMEEILNCHDHGSDYLADFATYYCEAFGARLEFWSPRLRDWALRTGQCLQESLYRRRDLGLQSCARLEKAALASHTECYRWAGICELPADEVAEIFSVLRWTDVTRHPWRIGEQIADLVSACWPEEF